MMRRDYESDGSDFLSAVAASAHAIHSLAEITPNPKIARANTRKQEPQEGGNILFPSFSSYFTTNDVF